MTEHLCVVCPQLRPNAEPRVYERANVDEGCRVRLGAILVEISVGYRQLAGELVPGQGHGERVSGSREAPLPLRVNPLDLTLPARVGNIHEPPCTCKEPRADCRPGQPHRDQAGFMSVATILDSWVRDWRDVLRLQEGLPRPNVRHLTIWLGHRLQRACDDHPAIDEFAAEMRSLAIVIRRTIGTTEVRPEHLDVPCRRCDLLDLHRLPGQDRIECASCGDLLTEDEYRRWTKLLAADLSEANA